MKMRRLNGFLALAVACLMFGSCIDSETPICSPDRTKADAELLGAWRSKLDDGTVEYYHIASAGDRFPQSVLRGMAIIHTPKGTMMPPVEMLAYPAVVGKNRYLNVAVVEGDNIKKLAEDGWKLEYIKGYFILKYEIENDVLTVWAMDPEAKRQAIESEKILGRQGENPVFTDATAKLVELLMSAQQNSQLYEKKVKRFARVK